MVLKNLLTEIRCTRCRKNSMMSDNLTGEKFCGNCGYVDSGTIVDSGQEWRSFPDDNGERARAGAPTSLTMHDMGLATIISPINRDSSGKPLSTSMRSTIERLRTWDSRSQVHESVDRNFRQAFSELGRLKDKLTISNVVLEKAAYIYRKALQKGLVRGRSISVLIAASLYAACRDTETPRTLKDIGQAADIKKKDIARCYRLLHRELGLKMPVVNSIQCISRIASKIGISEKTRRIACLVLKEAQDSHESAGKNPMCLAATALYLACVKNCETLTQRDIAEAANVTEVTIGNRYKSLRSDHSISV